MQEQSVSDKEKVLKAEAELGTFLCKFSPEHHSICGGCCGASKVNMLEKPPGITYIYHSTTKGDPHPILEGCEGIVVLDKEMFTTLQWRVH